jgi:regulator of sigma E protease
MEVFLIKLGQLLLSLSILVVLHEMGHFLPAKWFKCRVEKFYLFFDPWFSIFKKKVGETEYGVGWLPLGGYVKIAGMIDESMDKEQMKQPPQPWEFRSKPAWQRLIIMLGGVTVNLVLAMMIYAMLLFKHGEQILPMQNVTNGVFVADSMAYKLGIVNGDKILSINNEPVVSFTNFESELLLNLGKTIQVERNGEVIDLTVPEGFIGEMAKKRKGVSLIAPRIPTYVAQAAPASEALRIGLESGDQLIAINDTETPFYDQFSGELKEHAGHKVAITWIRGEEVMSDSALITEDGKLGFMVNMNFADFFETDVIKYGFFASFPAGISKGFSTLNQYVKSFGVLFSGEVKVKDSVGGFISIGNIFSPVWDWTRFWELTALLSVMLAFVNVLPIPALDGGHALFTIYEIVFRRKPNEKFMEYAQTFGMILLLFLIVYINGLDVLRHVFGK